MSLLIETIRLLDGKFYNLPYHEQRMARSRKSLFNNKKPVMLEKLLRERAFPTKGLYKCRVLYGKEVTDVGCTPYEARTVKRIKLVEDDTISYAFKYADRGPINRLFDLRGDCDDVLIIRRGLVTDCSYANIVFRAANNWFTPASPLLEGTMRQQLLEKNKITAREIHKDDIRSFDACRIINAMLEFDSPDIEVSNIVF